MCATFCLHLVSDYMFVFFFFFQAEDGIRDLTVTGVQTCALPISIKPRLKGPCGVVISEGAGGLDALAHARRTIRRGTEVVVSGGTEAPISPYALTCQLKSGLLSASADPASAYCPFDARAAGYVPGHGGAILILEDRA